MDIEASNREALEQLRAFVATESPRLGARITEERVVQGGTQVVVSNGQDRIPVTPHHSGTILAQGPDRGLRLAAERWKTARTPPQ